MNLEDLGVQELNAQDVKENDGGWGPVLWLIWEMIDPGNAGDAKAGEDFAKSLY